MPHFSKRITSKEGDLNFYFNRIYTATGMRYHISVVDKNKKTHMCLMEKINEHWQIVDRNNCDELFLGTEPELRKAIVRHLQEVTEG